MKVPIFEHLIIRPLEYFEVSGRFWEFHADTIIYTWIAMAVLLGVVMLARYYLKRGGNTFTFALELLVQSFSDLCVESFGYFKYNYFVFITSLFLFTLSCNVVGVLPFVKESTEDLNTTLAIALVSFIFIQKETIKKEGLRLYLKEYFQPIFLLFPINVIEKLAKIVSMSFRLFGNILGGSIIMYLMVHAIEEYRVSFIIGSGVILLGYGLLSLIKDKRQFFVLRKIFWVGWITLYCLAGVKMFFGIFESIIQAFVVAMLTLTYLSVVAADEGEKDQHGAVKPSYNESVKEKA